MKRCACGCGQVIHELSTYARGHHNRVVEKSKEPIIELLDAPHDDDIHNIFECEIIPIPVSYSCKCGFFGSLLSTATKCPLCKVKLKYKDKNLVLD